MSHRTTRIGLLLPLAAMAALVACVPTMPGAPTTPNFQPPLADTAWRLQSLGQSGHLAPALANREVTLVFSGDSQAAGTAGCNSYGGAYESSLSGTLSFTDLVHTEMYCVEPGVMEQERFFLESLAAAEEYEVVDHALRLSGGGRLLVFSRS